MAHTSHVRFQVLHSLRLKGFAEPASLAAATLLAPEAIDEQLTALEADGLAQYRQGRISGWTLTPDGRHAHGAEAAADLMSARCRAAVEEAYQRFLAANADMLGVCTDWQMRPEGSGSVPNDHGDPAYDAGVIERLGAIDAQVQPVCAALAGEMDRFSNYGPRLASALSRIRAGGTEWFTRPLMDSYHTVWFELHEDLLCTLGLERSRETTPV